MNYGPFVAIDANQMPWEERFHDKVGKAIYRKEDVADKSRRLGSGSFCQTAVATEISMVCRFVRWETVS